MYSAQHLFMVAGVKATKSQGMVGKNQLPLV